MSQTDKAIFSVSVHDIDQSGPSVKDLQCCEKIFSLVERERDGRKSPWDMTVGVLYKQQVAYGTWLEYGCRKDKNLLFPAWRGISCLTHHKNRMTDRHGSPRRRYIKPLCYTCRHLKNACMQSLTNLFTPRKPSVHLKGSLFSCVLEGQKVRTFAVHIDCTWFAISISVISLFLIQESETTWTTRMDSIIYPGADKLWPTRVGDPPRSSAFVDLTSQNELYQRNQGTCGYGECIEGSCRLFIRSYKT